jgi:hypothetical protein
MVKSVNTRQRPAKQGTKICNKAHKTLLHLPVRRKAGTVSTWGKLLHLLDQCGPTGGTWTTSGLKQLVTRSAKLHVNLLLVITSSSIFCTSKDIKKAILILSTALCTSVTHAIDFVFSASAKTKSGLSFNNLLMTQCKKTCSI